MTPRSITAVGMAVVLATVLALTSTSVMFTWPAQTTAARADGVSATPQSSGSVLIRNIPHLRQKPDFCGEACVTMYLQKLGQPVDQDYVFDLSGVDPLEARGCHTKDLAKAVKTIGFDVGAVWYRIPSDESDVGLESQWQALHADLVAGIPSIVCMHYDASPETTEHFRLVLGYDADSDEVVYHEPAEEKGAYRRIRRSVFLKLWPLKYRPQEWTVIRMPLKSGHLRRGKVASSFTSADYAQHLMGLRKKMPSQGFTVVIQPPFVVVGDESPAMVKRRAESTVKWAADKLREAYFRKDPSELLDIWLFKDKTSYEKHVKRIFGTQPHTPFGYFSQSDRALIMNIATGGGTLVHEIVHPFMAANFPECPASFNEGLGSLYEQCGEVDGKIQGRTNWRLSGLQQAIRKQQLPSFKTLCSTTDFQFYNEDKGTNYAHARYLCYYLEQHKLLREFYRRFHANRTNDPSGYATLKTVLGRDDMDAFQKEWEEYVMKLRFNTVN